MKAIASEPLNRRKMMVPMFALPIVYSRKYIPLSVCPNVALKSDNY
jgi:hypothetical protein